MAELTISSVTSNQRCTVDSLLYPQAMTVYDITPEIVKVFKQVNTDELKEALMDITGGSLGSGGNKGFIWS